MASVYLASESVILSEAKNLCTLPAPSKCIDPSLRSGR